MRMVCGLSDNSQGQLPINLIAVQGVTNLFRWQLHIQLLGLMVKKIYDGIGIMFVGVSAIIAVPRIFKG
jgi:hypothetical protein